MGLSIETKIYVRPIIILYLETMSCVCVYMGIFYQYELSRLDSTENQGKTITQNKTTSQLNCKKENKRGIQSKLYIKGIEGNLIMCPL